jgi:hypothetical protein
MRMADSSSTNVANFSLARTMNRFPSPRCASATKLFVAVKIHGAVRTFHPA